MNRAPKPEAWLFQYVLGWRADPSVFLQIYGTSLCVGSEPEYFTPAVYDLSLCMCPLREQALIVATSASTHGWYAGIRRERGAALNPPSGLLIPGKLAFIHLTHAQSATRLWNWHFRCGRGCAALARLRSGACWGGLRTPYHGPLDA